MPLPRSRTILPLTVALGSLPLCGCNRAPAAVPAPGPQILFEDVASRAGLRLRWGHNGKSPLTNLESFGVGCAFLDYDGDGLLDILLVSEPVCALYRNEGDGSFSDTTRQAGLAAVKGRWKGVAAADYDNDGRLDLFLSGYEDAALLRNEGMRFRNVTREAGIRQRGWGASAAFADFDADGRLDLFVGSYVRFGPKSLQYCTFGNNVKAGCPPRVYPAEKGMMYRNEDGRFRDVTKAWGLEDSDGKNLGVAPCDYDDDGDVDLYVANDGVAGDLFRNDGPGRFTNVGVLTGTAFGATDQAQAGMGVDWADYDNDGRFDLVVTAFSDEMYSLYRNEGPAFRHASQQVGIAAATIAPLGFGTKFLDADNDGWRDLLFANGHVYDRAGEIDPRSPYRQPMQLFRNRGGTFEEVSARAGEPFQRPIVGRGCAAGDYDNDGKPDLLVVDYEGAPLLLHNVSRGTGAFLTLRLEQPGRNRFAYGARVRLSAPGLSAVGDVAPGGSYLSSGDPRVHFGLPANIRTVTLDVRWPDGKRDAYTDVPVNALYRLRRGETAPSPEVPGGGSRPPGAVAHRP